jgi:hypothetical protein
LFQLWREIGWNRRPGKPATGILPALFGVGPSRCVLALVQALLGVLLGPLGSFAILPPPPAATTASGSVAALIAPAFIARARVVLFCRVTLCEIRFSLPLHFALHQTLLPRRTYARARIGWVAFGVLEIPCRSRTDRLVVLLGENGPVAVML